MAGQRGAPRRHRPALRRRRLPDRHRLLRDLRPRPAHRRRRSPRPSTARWTRRPGVPQGAPTTPRRTRSRREEYPLRYTTGRTVYQFHTRTKTGRSRDAATRPHRTPGSSSRSADADAARHRARATGCGSSRRAAPSRCAPGSGEVMAGAVFAPFHYGHWDPDPDGRRARRRGPPAGQRAHHDRVGPGLQAAVPSRPPPAGSPGRAPGTAPRRRRPPRPRPASGAGAASPHARSTAPTAAHRGRRPDDVPRARRDPDLCARPAQGRL